MSFARLVFLGAAIGLALPTFAAAENLVVNGSFETQAFTGWTLFGNAIETSDPNYMGVYCLPGGFGALNPTNGVCDAYFGPFSEPGGVSQTLVSSATQTYHVSFDWFNVGGPPNSISVQLGTDTLLSYTDLPPTTTPGGAPYWNHYSATIPGSLVGTDPTLTFTFTQIPSWFVIDNVVVSTPEPGVYGVLAMGLAGVLIALRRRKIA